MSLLTICQNVARDLGIDIPPAPIFGSSLPTARRLVAQARRAAFKVHSRALWPQTVVEHQFIADGASDYALPADFYRIINNTAWERTRYWAMRGSLSPQQWQTYRSSIYGRATLWRRWRIRIPSGDGSGTLPTFSIDPPVSAHDSTSQFVFEYQSTNFIQHQPAGTMVPDWTADTDICVIEEGLVELDTLWRVARRIGLDYAEEKDEADRQIDQAIARAGGTANLDLVPWSRWDDFIGQYSLGAFPPYPPPSGQPPPGQFTLGTSPLGGPAPLGPVQAPVAQMPPAPAERAPAAPAVIRVGLQPLAGVASPRPLPPGTLGI